MGIQNFPASLQPAIQLGYLAREFEKPLRSKLGYRMIADRESFAIGIGETLTKTRNGLKATATTPLSPSTNTNLDNGITPSGWKIEQYTLALNMYGDSIDLNMVTSRVGIANQFLVNAEVTGEQAARTIDELARNALYSPYLGGNTRVRVTLGSANATVSVDDIRGFLFAFSNGVQQPVSNTYPLTVTIGATIYTVIGATPDGSNVSTSPNGISGTLTVAALNGTPSTVSTSDGTAENSVSGATASTIIRPNGRGNTSLLQATDTLVMGNLLDAVATLRKNAVPTVEGVYNCYLDPVSSRELFSDPDFKQLFQGASAANSTFKNGVISDFLGLRFIMTTEAPQQVHPSIAGLIVHRPIVAGMGALIEGDFAGMDAEDVAPKDSIIEMVDGVCMVTREPLDRFQQIIAQSWYWIGGFCVPSDTTTTALTVPTSTNAAYKRAVVLEHV